MKHMRQKHTSVWSPAAWRRWDLARMCCTNFEVGITVQSGLPMASAAVAFIAMLRDCGPGNGCEARSLWHAMGCGADM